MSNNLLLDFITECFTDTYLVKNLLNMNDQQIKKVNHQHSCTRVCNIMESQPFKDNFAVGIIDDDKLEPEYSRSFNKIACSKHLTLLKKGHHYIIKVAPAMEKFILSCAKESKIKLKDYELSDDFKELKKIANSLDPQNETRFKRALKDMGNAKEIEILGKVLKYLNENRYNCDPEVLKSFFE